VNVNLSKKIDSEVFNNSLSQIKNDIYESLTHYKNDILQNKKAYEEHLNERLIIIEKKYG